MTPERKGYCVYGEWRESSSQEYKLVTNSSTGEIISEVPQCTQQEVEAAIDSAHQAFKEGTVSFHVEKCYP